MEHYTCIVVGGGVMGCAATYHLAKRRHRALLLEQFALGHDHGSSHGHSRIIRLAYDIPDYINLARIAFALWRSLEAEAGVPLLLTTGGLDLAPPGETSFAATCAALAQCNVDFELLDRAALADRFPQFQLPDQMLGLYQHEAGILYADRCVELLAAQALRYGALIHEHEPVRHIRPTGTGVEVSTDMTTYHAERLIITAGSWMRQLLGQIGLDIPLTVTRELFAFFTPSTLDLFQPGRFPVFIQHEHGSLAAYGFPIFGLPGIKVGRHLSGPRIAPADDSRDVDPAQLAELQVLIANLLPQGAGQLITAQTCRYTLTPDSHFIIDRHPSYPQIVIGSPCSGHGFKFGILIGSILADLAEYGATEHPIGRFGLARFQ